ncbi:MAG: hypothetical protein ACO3XO_00570 [Bdellovibrionota bacterium]|jgi:hypothetical protein
MPQPAESHDEESSSSTETQSLEPSFLQSLADAAFSNLRSLFRNKTSLEPLTLQQSDLEETDRKLFIKEFSKIHNQTDESPFSDDKNNVKDYAKHRLTIEQAVDLSHTQAHKWKSIRDLLNSADCTYATLEENARLITTLLPHREKKGMIETLSRIARGVSVPITSHSSDAQHLRGLLTTEEFELLVHLQDQAVFEVPVPETLKNYRQFDGYYIGSQNQTSDGSRAPIAFHAHSIPHQITPIMPTQLRDLEAPIRFCFNGLNTTVHEHFELLETLADFHEAPLIGVYSAKMKNVRGEFKRAINDSLDRRDNPTINTGRDLVLATILADEPLSLIGISHGCSILTKALNRAAFLLREQKGWSARKIEDAFALLTIETYGGATWSYPDGPDYRHYIYKPDPVPFTFGLTPLLLSSSEHHALQEHFQDSADSFFAGLQKFHSIVKMFLPEPKIHPGRNAEIILLEHSHNPAEHSPHSLTAYIDAIRATQRKKL